MVTHSLIAISQVLKFLLSMTGISRWMRSNKAQVRTKPLPQVRVKKDIDEDVEMGNLTDNTTENKDDNYFEDTSDTGMRDGQSPMTSRK